MFFKHSNISENGQRLPKSRPSVPKIGIATDWFTRGYLIDA